MEQKTEASQAVDLPVLPHLPRAVGYRHTMDNTEGIKGNKPQIYFSSTKPAPFGIPGLDYSASFPVTTEALFTADQMKEYARAALKAQPAPTEAAQGDYMVRMTVPDAMRIVKANWPDMGRIERAFFANVPSTSAAQGEDSARLDAERYQFLRHADLDELARVYWPDAEVPVGEELDDIIDRARASAETGGVKP